MANVLEMAAFICQKSYVHEMSVIRQWNISDSSVFRQLVVRRVCVAMRPSSVHVRLYAFSGSDMSVIRQLCK